MFKPLYSMTSFNRFRVLVPTLLYCILLFSCGSEEPSSDGCAIYGSVSCSSPKGVKVSLKNVSNSSLKYVAITDDNGNFEIQNISPGTYSVDAIKDDYRWLWMKFDGKVNHENRLIDIKSATVKELNISLLKSSDSNSQKQLELKDMDGNTITGSIFIPKNASTIVLRVYNGTNTTQAWNILFTDICSISFSENYKHFVEPVFDSFSPTSGTLNPGESAILFGIINANIFNHSDYDFDYSITQILFDSGRTSRDIFLDIELK